MGSPLVAFVGIFKNEASNIKRTLESVRPFVDRWTILDTGSTDATREIVHEVMAGISGDLYEEPFEDYATTRNRVLELERANSNRAVFTLTLSGDEVLEGGPALREYLESKREAADGAYCVELHEMVNSGVKRCLYCRVLRSDAGWKYVGDPHEIPQGSDTERNGPTVPGVSVVFSESDPKRKLKRMREYDLPRLRKRVLNESATLDERSQAIWFLGMTYEALAEEYARDSFEWREHLLSAMALYSSVATLGDDPLKAGYAYLLGIKVAERLGFLYSYEELCNRAKIAIEMHPRLPEARYFLAFCAASVDVRQGLYFAEEAARVAREAAVAQAERDQTFYLPTDSRMEWLALGIAAQCARQLKNEKRVRELAERAVAAGGPREMFEGFLG